ncbi:MAG: protein kinase [Chloroflexi bacterium]|nr:protein kinase [Chloroflexota bacterium]
MSDWVGRTISKVEIDRMIGRGGMAEVYLGRHTTLNRPVAVKVLQAHLLDDESQMSRFTAEAQSVASLRHPNIVQVYDFDVLDDRPYIVMELLDGLSLKEYLKALGKAGGTLSQQTVLRIITELASALDYAHERQIIHRDVKPANVMLRSEAGPIDATRPLSNTVDTVLTDFGIARIADASHKTASGVIVGTPAYMSPEQASGEKVTPSSDIYSLGVMLYELLSGRLPFDGETSASVLLKHMTEVPPTLEGATPELDLVLTTALAKRPADRFQTAGALADALRSALAGESPVLMTGSIYETTPMPPMAQTNTPAPAATATLPSPVPPTTDTGQQTQPSTSTDSNLTATAQINAGGFNPMWIVGGVGALALLIAVIALAAIALDNDEIEPVAAATDAVAEATDIPTEAPAAENDPTEEETEEPGTENEPTPAPTAPPEADLDPKTPIGTIVIRDDTLSAILAGIPDPEEGTFYAAWLTEPETNALFLARLSVSDGQASFAFTDPGGENLLATYSQLAVSVEESRDTDPIQPATIVFETRLADDLIERLRHLDELSRGLTFQEALLNGSGALLRGLNRDTQAYNDHRGFAISALANNNLVGGKLHSEHVINIVAGDRSPEYNDWDGSGLIENPGDGFGLRNYLLMLIDGAQGIQQDPNSPEDTITAAESLATQATELLQTVEDASVVAQDVTFSDSIEGAGPLGETLDLLGIDVTELEDLAQSLNLAITAELFPVAE